MRNLILTPLGAGNYQYVVRITSSIDNNIKNNIILLKNSENDNNVPQIYNKNTDFPLENTYLGLIPRFCVLKILKRENVHDYISRIQFHYEFNHVFNHFINQESLCSTNLNNIANNVPYKRLCIIERNVSHKLRNVFNQLLVPNSVYSNNNIVNLESVSLIEGHSVKVGNKNKIMIFYDKLLEKTHSIDVDPNSIKVLDFVDLVGHNHHSAHTNTFDIKGSFFDETKYELCSIEEDLFNYNGFIKTNNALNIPHSLYTEDCGLHQSDGPITPTNTDRYSNFRNISLELKLKCGLKNFKGYPSLFEMNQINKMNVNYIISNGCSVSNSKQKSFYDPCAFFELNYKSVRGELINLIQIPQNNLRIFVNNYQQIPNILIGGLFDAHLLNGTNNKTNHNMNGIKNHIKDTINTHYADIDNDLIEMIVKSILDNKRKLLLLLKLQSLAAGQQFVSSVLYSLYNLFLRIQFVANGTGNCDISSSFYGIFNSNLSSVYGLKCGDIFGNCSVNDGDIVSIIKSMNLYRHFKSSTPNHYDIQRRFYKRGLKLLYKLHIKLLSVLNNLKMCRFYTSNANLSIHRLSNRFNHNKYLLFVLLNDLIGCLFSHIHKHSTTSTNVNNTNVTDITNNVNTMNDGLDLLMLNDSSIKTALKTLYYRNKKSKMKRMYYSINFFPNKRELKLIREWIYLYLCGRVSMDSSVIINIFYRNRNGSNPANDILYNKLSFVDVDLKSIHNIHKWKYNVVNLINSYIDST